MRRNPVATVGVAVSLCVLVAVAVLAAESNVYWRVDLNQGTSIIAYGQGSTQDAAWQDCFRLRAITRAMTAAETRRGPVAAIASPAVRWCKNPMQLATVRPDPVAPPPTCAAAPADRVIACPAPTVGSWIQRATVGPPPDCTITWAPLTTPAGACVTPPPMTATLSWTPPTQNTDGTALTDLAGFRIHYGTIATAMTQVVQLANPGLARYVIENLSPGVYYFAVRAYKADGVESPLSNIASKTVQ